MFTDACSLPDSPVIVTSPGVGLANEVSEAKHNIGESKSEAVDADHDGIRKNIAVCAGGIAEAREKYKFDVSG